MDDLKIKFGKQIKKFRLKRNLSQEELAEMVDIAVNNMGKIERGESFVTSANLEKLAEALNVRVQEFFTFENSISIEDMKRELDLERMSDDEIKNLYRFYKLYLRIPSHYE